MSSLPQHSPTYVYALELYIKMLSKGKHQITYQESADITGYSRSEGKDAFKLFQDITVVEQNVFDELSSGAAKLVQMMIKQLKYNNALWHYEPQNSKAYVPITELVDKGILKRTETPYIFLVNPMLIRRGTAQGVLCETINLLKTVVKVNKDHIHDIKYTGPIKLSDYDIMGLDIAAT